VKTFPLFTGQDFWHSAASMFLRATNRKKDGKDHRYFSIVENRRVPGGKREFEKGVAVWEGPAAKNAAR
jgi:hypothetical protein